MASFSRRSKKRGFWKKIWLSINLFFASCLIISYLAPITDPQFFWPIAFFGLVYMPLLIINLVFAFSWLFIKPILSLLSLIAILVGWSSLEAHIGLGTNLLEEKIPQKDSLNVRVMSYNVRLFRSIENEQNGPNSQKDIIQLAKEVNPDIICFQEYYTREKGKNNMNSLIKKELGIHHYFFHPTAKNSFDSYGLAIFSKYPILDAGHLSEFEKGVNSIVYVDLQIGQDTLRVFNVHLRSFGFQKEDYEFINKTNTTLEEDVQNTKRIGSRIKSAYQGRSDQAKAFKKHLDETLLPFVIAGDFNDTPLSFVVNHVGKNLKNAFKEKGRGWGKTYNGDFPNFQIDYIYTSPEIQIDHFRIIPKKLSDHYPIWADVHPFGIDN